MRPTSIFTRRPNEPPWVTIAMMPRPASLVPSASTSSGSDPAYTMSSYPSPASATTATRSTDPDDVEALGTKLAGRGIMAIVTHGGSFGRRVKIDVGRIHYDLIRYVGTTGDDARDAYARIPVTCEQRAGDRVAVIGAAGPMGLMHTVRTAVSGIEGLTLDAVDVDDDRLARLAKVLG